MFSFKTFSIILIFLFFSACTEEKAAPPSSSPKGIAGSVGCRDCHEKFHELWANSFHGLAMQPFTSELAHKDLAPQTQDIRIGEYNYRVEFDDQGGRVVEKGDEGEKKYPMMHALGGKNVYYFLTQLEKGRLQTLPLAYDVNSRQWFDTAASGMRHVADESLHWKDSAYTFNTACYRCHVSQLSTNYDLSTDTYHTTWVEPGINCETCHGPAEEHIRVCRSAPEGKPPQDLKITRGGRDFTAEQRNDVCAPCHAQMVPITDSFQPGDRFFDHYNLTALEDEDFHPDGRDLGENYTYTLWRMSPCVKSGQLDCMHCHTSSGRFRQKDDPDSTCLPCHKQRVENSTEHTRHEADSEGSRCIACHMPMTEFARMRRSDHSMLPPTPAATMQFESPNACNMCHTDKDAAWADQNVRQWHENDYQKPVLERAALIAAARKGDWSQLPAMLHYIADPNSDEIFVTGLVRLLRSCDSPEKWPTILKALEHTSPLVRSAAAASLEQWPSRDAVQALIRACNDDFRLVRVQAAAALAPFLPQLSTGFMDEQQREEVDRATKEFIATHKTRPDQWTSHYNLGNYYLDLQKPEKALMHYKTALRLEPQAVLVLVNASMAHARQGQNDKAQELLLQAFKVQPESAVVHFNLGLLMAEQNDPAAAEKHLRAALKANPQMHEAAFNLGILLAETKTDEAIGLCRKAYELNPSAQYAYTLAFYLYQNDQNDSAAEVLQELIKKQPAYVDAYLMLGEIYEKQGRGEDARSLYMEALAQDGLSQQDKARFIFLLQQGNQQ